MAKEGWYDAAARQAADAVELHVPVRNASLSPSEADAQAIRAEIERAVLEKMCIRDRPRSLRLRMPLP